MHYSKEHEKHFQKTSDQVFRNTQPGVIKTLGQIFLNTRLDDLIFQKNLTWN